jgi:hypothetical protein
MFFLFRNGSFDDHWKICRVQEPPNLQKGSIYSVQICSAGDFRVMHANSVGLLLLQFAAVSSSRIFAVIFEIHHSDTRT